MKKVLLATMLVLLFAGSAYAQATFSMTGDFWAEGKYWFNYNSAPDTDANYNDSSFGFYEQDINLYPKITAGDTSLNFKLAITDIYWGAAAADGDENTKGNDASNDDNIAIERAWVKHKFNDVLTVDVGLQDGTQWGTTFGDDKTGRWRVKFVETTKLGAFGQVLEKITDNGAIGQNADDENNDSDNYGLFYIGKVGNVFIKPLWFHVDTDGLLPGEDYLKRENFALAFNGDVGINFETELNYNDYKLKWDTVAVKEHWKVWGYYLNLWKAMDSMTPGFVFAYGSFDKNARNSFAGTSAALTAQAAAATAAAAAVPLPYNAAQAAQVAALQAGAASATTAATSLNTISQFTAFDFDDDFNSTVILGDEFCWGGPGDDLQGMTMLKFYVDNIKTGMAPLTISTYAAYVMSNQEDTDYEDATAWELGVGANYKITENLSYKPYAAYADMNYDVDGVDDPDAAYILANALEFTF